MNANRVHELAEHWKLGVCQDCRHSMMLEDHAEAAMCPYCGAIGAFKWQWGRLRIYFVEDQIGKTG